MEDAIFERDGDRYVATTLAQGPWDAGSCHGGAPAALLAVLVDQAPSLAPMQPVRLTYDLLKPVPVGAPMAATTTVVRDGKRVQVLEVVLTTAAGVELVRCRALRVRIGTVAMPPDATSEEPPPSPMPERLSRFAGGGGWAEEGFWRAIDVRFADGSPGPAGPATAWFRVAVPICNDIEVTPLARVAAAADFGNGVGSPLPIGRFLFINPDLTIHVHRLPVGDWVALMARSVAQATGVGLSTSGLYDEHGRIGVAAQSLYVATAGSSGDQDGSG